MYIRDLAMKMNGKRLSGQGTGNIPAMLMDKKSVLRKRAYSEKGERGARATIID